MHLTNSLILLFLSAAAITSTAAASTNKLSCDHASYGLGNKNGYKGYCCKTEADCYYDCVSGICTGSIQKTSTKKTSTKTTSTKKGSSLSAMDVLSCDSGSYGLGNGNGHDGYCCKTKADCYNDCVSGKCTGSTKKTSTKTASSKATSKKIISAASTCHAGSKGKKKNNGKTGYCCSSSKDCLKSCKKGKCTK